MKTIADFVLDKVVNEKSDSFIYQAYDSTHEKKCLIKVLKSDYPSISQIENIKSEYSLIQSINSKYVTKATDLVQVENSYLIVFEAVEGGSLSDYIQKESDMKKILTVAINLTDMLSDIHKNHIVLKEISPDSIYINPDTLSLILLDVGSPSISLEKHISQIRHNPITLNYISPELTGRMKRKIDYRSNIYSLGILMYYFVTHSLPFNDNDPMVVIHSHIAQMPLAPIEIDHTLPKAISDIIMKCLQKIPEDRYQSTSGLKADLQFCLVELEKNGVIQSNFEPGLMDIQETFQISGKIYGRKSELLKIREIHYRSSISTPELVLISGEAGIGKTCFINELSKSLPQNSIVITGNYEISNQHIQFSGLVDAFKKLIHQLLKEKEEKLAPFREELINALQNNGQLIIDVIPELEFIIGKQVPVSKLNIEENRIRFQRVFVQLIQVFATAEHPLTIILEDLQLADLSSLNCIKDFLIEKKVNYLLFIGTYSTQETHANHILNTIINELRRENINVEIIELGPLKIDETTQFIADSLRTPKEKVQPLATLLHNKTNGNPFFLNQLLKKLHEDELIKFHHELKEWQWDLNRVKKLELSENVVDLMIEKIRQFPLETQDTLSKAAAIGPKFTLDLLSNIANTNPQIVLKNLVPALQADLIQPLQSNMNIQKLMKQDQVDIDQIIDHVVETKELVFEFINFKIHQASDSLSLPDEKLRQHYLIGKFLLKEIEKPEHSQNNNLFFEFLKHLNLAQPLITNAEEKLKLAKFNLEACYKAKNSTANALALDLITKARQLLPTDAWKNHYQLAYAVFLESTDCSLLQKKFDEIEMFSSEILKHAKTKIDKARLYIIKMIYYTNASQYNRVLEIGINCAGLFGLKIPKNPSVFQILKKFFYIKLLIGKKDLRKWAENSPPTNEEIISLQKLLVIMGTPSFLSNKHLFAYVGLLGMQLVLKHGYCIASSVIYGYYGLLVQSLFKDYKAATELLKLSIELGEKEGIHMNCCQSYFISVVLTGHWTLPFVTLSDHLVKCYNHGLDSGALFFISYVTIFFGFGDGVYYKNLVEADNLLNSHSKLLLSSKNLQATQSFILRKNILRVFMEPNFRGFNMSNENFDEEEFHNIIRNNTQYAQAYQAYIAYKSMVFNLFGFYKEALNLYKSSKASRAAVEHFITQKDQNFYHSLNMIAVYENASFKERFIYRWTIAKNQRALKKWMSLNPQTNSHRFTLVNAELARILGNIDEALKLYDEAIRLANENNFIGEAALANELAAKLYFKLKRFSLGKFYLREAHYTYYRWGAMSKASQIEELYPEYIENKVSSSSREKSTSLKSDDDEDNFDLAALIRVSSVISKEIYLDKLLNEVLRLLIVEAGADRAIFLMESDNKWVIQGEKRAGEEGSEVLQALPFESHPEMLSAPIINFVLRTKEKVIINDTSKENIFSRDSYLKENNVKATLCIPVISQGKLSAILYLENKSSSDVFNQERIRILEILSTQIASSIENSNLYTKLEQYNRNLENKVLERTNEIQQKNSELASTLEELKNTQNHLVESGKMAALGQLIAGIAHEINTPLGAVKASSQNANEAIKTLTEIMPALISGHKLEIFSHLTDLSTRSKPTQLSSKEERQIKKETLDSFEQKNIPHAYELVELLFDIGIREDLSDLLLPIGENALGLVTFVYNFSSIHKNNQNNLLAVERASKIIFALKSYIHRDTLEVMVPGSIIEGMESILTLYHHQLKLDIQVEKHFEEVPLIPCRINELNQVWTNLIHNALQSMSNKGTLEINIFPQDTWVVIQIIDSGRGIPEEVKPKIFSPFFTTKARGEGSGLGLSVSKKIIDAHGGTISFESVPGRTTFSVKLPIAVTQEPKKLVISNNTNVN